MKMCTLLYIILISLTGTAYNSVYAASDSDWDLFSTTEFPLVPAQHAIPIDDCGQLLEPVFAPTTDTEDGTPDSLSFETLSKRPRTRIETTSEQHEHACSQTIQALQSKTDELKKNVDQVKKKLKESKDSIRRLKKLVSRQRFRMHLCEERLNAYSERLQQQLTTDREMTPIAAFNGTWQQLSLSFKQVQTPIVLRRIDDFIAILPPSIGTHSPLMQRVLKTKAEYAYCLFKDAHGDRADILQEKQQYIETAVTYFSTNLQNR